MEGDIMIIKKWDKSVGLKGRCYYMNTTIERPKSILQSIEDGFKEVKEFKEGKRKFKTLEESKRLWEQWASEDDDE